MIPENYKRAALLILLFFITSCTQQFAIKPDDFEQYGIALVQVESELPESEDQVIRLTAMIVDGLSEKNIFQDVFHETQKSQVQILRVNVVITSINRTPDVQRLALGKMARSNEVAVQVVLSDNATQGMLSAFQLKAISPKRFGINVEWPWGSVDKALQKVSDQLVRQLADWSSRTKG